MTGPDLDLTCDAFLGGRLSLWQPRGGYRAGIDPVLLAASVPARGGQTVLDLGCGAGAAALCLAARVPGLRLTGVERQEAYAKLARRNALDNQADLTVVEADLTALPADLRQQRFDHVIANPPYFRADAHTISPDDGRGQARGEDTPMADWIDVATRRLAPKGYLHMIHRASHVPDLLVACDGRLGSLELLPLAPRAGHVPHLVILRARKGGKAAFCLHSPVVLHSGDRHEIDGDSYAPDIAAVLRDAAVLGWAEPRC